jgi:hypothetical protein
MGRPVKACIVLVCLSLCAVAAMIAKGSSAQAKIGNTPLPSLDRAGDYVYAASDAPLQLSLNDIESIIRRDPATKARHGKMEFGSVKVEHGAVVAEVMFLQTDGQMQAFLYKIRHENKSWKVASAQRLWFVPRSHFLRGLRA